VKIFGELVSQSGIQFEEDALLVADTFVSPVEIKTSQETIRYRQLFHPFHHNLHEYAGTDIDVFCTVIKINDRNKNIYDVYQIKYNSEQINDYETVKMKRYELV